MKTITFYPNGTNYDKKNGYLGAITFTVGQTTDYRGEDGKRLKVKEIRFGDTVVLEDDSEITCHGIGFVAFTPKQ